MGVPKRAKIWGIFAYVLTTHMTSSVSSFKLISSIDVVQRLSSLDVDGLMEYKRLMECDAPFFHQLLQSDHNLARKEVSALRVALRKL